MKSVSRESRFVASESNAITEPSPEMEMDSHPLGPLSFLPALVTEASANSPEAILHVDVMELVGVPGIQVRGLRDERDLSRQH